MINNQKKKFTSDIRWTSYVAVIFKNGKKEFINSFDYNNPDILRELTTEEYIEFIHEQGFVKGCYISRWNNTPVKLQKIEVYPTFHTQPYLIDLFDYYFPKGHGMALYNYKLKVEQPTKFWHYNFKNDQNN